MEGLAGIREVKMPLAGSEAGAVLCDARLTWRTEKREL